MEIKKEIEERDVGGNALQKTLARYTVEKNMDFLYIFSVAFSVAFSVRIEENREKLAHGE